MLYACIASNTGAERLLIHCFPVNMRELSPARQTFTAAGAKPSPDNGPKVAREESQMLRLPVCRGSSKENIPQGLWALSIGGILWSVIVSQGLLYTQNTSYADRRSAKVSGDRRADGWLMNSPPASQSDRRQLPPSWPIKWAGLPGQGSARVCQGVFEKLK